MAPEAPGNLVVIDLRFEDGELSGVSQSVEYSPGDAGRIERAGGWFYVLWNETPIGDGFTSIGDGVVYVHDLPDGYKIRRPGPVTIDSLGEHRYAYRYPALGEGLMFVLILPEDYTIVHPRPVPRSAKIFKKQRLAVYWKPEGKYGAEVKVFWGLKTLGADIRKERDVLNAEIDTAENVPDNPGVIVDGGHISSDAPQNLTQAMMRTVWAFHPRLRMLLLLLAGVIFISYVVWNSLPDSVKQKVLEIVLGRQF